MKRILDGRTVAGMGLLFGIGLVAGLVGNLMAGPTRRLEWNRDYPPKGKPNCPETLPVPGQEATAGAPASTSIALAAPAEASAAPAASAPAPVASAPDGAAPAMASAAAPAPASVPAATSAPAPASAPAATSAAAATAPASAAPAAVDVPPVPPDKPWIEVSPAQADALFDRGALFVDARMTTQYQDGHVRGAVAIPIWEAGVDEKIAQVAFDVEGDMNRPIVVYCNGGDCEDSHALGQKLWEAGHVAVYVYKDGYPDWIKRGRPVSTGDAR